MPDDFIQEVLARADIVDVVGQVVSLKKAGQNHFGLCPFHNEKSPSFSVSASKGFYHCFGCGAHGSAIGFIQEREGLSFREATLKLANQLGVPIPNLGDETPEQAKQREFNSRIYKALSDAADLFRKAAKDDPSAAAYIKSRGLDDQTVERFGIGYADYKHFDILRKKHGMEILTAAGLAAANKDTGETYPHFSGRIVFPVYTDRGAVSGFSGRKINWQPGITAGGKYKNSPDSKFFRKGSTLYGFYQAADEIRHTRHIRIIEGNIDVATMHQHGLANAVAPMGTAITERQLDKILRNADRITFGLDGDRAGQEAMDRAVEILLPMLNDANPKHIEFVRIPHGKDPDELLKEQGAAGWFAIEQQAIPLSQALINIAIGHRDLRIAEQRAMAAIEAGKLVSLIDHTVAPITRQSFQLAAEQAIGVRIPLTKEPLPPGIANKLSDTQTIQPHSPLTAAPPQPELHSRAQIREEFAAILSTLAADDQGKGMIYRIPIPSVKAPTPANLKAIGLTLSDGTLYASIAHDTGFDINVERTWHPVAGSRANNVNPTIDYFATTPSAMNALELIRHITTNLLPKLHAGHAIHPPVAMRNLQSRDADSIPPTFRVFAVPELDMIKPVILTGTTTPNGSHALHSQVTNLELIPLADAKVLQQQQITIKGLAGTPETPTHRVTDSKNNQYIVIAPTEANAIIQQLSLAPSYNQTQAIQSFGYQC